MQIVQTIQQFCFAYSFFRKVSLIVNDLVEICCHNFEEMHLLNSLVSVSFQIVIARFILIFDVMIVTLFTYSHHCFNVFAKLVSLVTKLSKVSLCLKLEQCSHLLSP